MQRLKPHSGVEWFRAFFKKCFSPHPQVMPNAPQSPLDSGTPPVENPIDGTHGSPSPPSLQTRRGHPNMTELNNGGSSPSPPEITGSPLVNGTHTSPHVDPRVGDLKKPVFNVQADSNIIDQGMKALSEHAIQDAEHDSSPRDPPPDCHPGTRVQLMEKILAWLRNGGREKALLWLNGPAGVGKSAVIQTVAESLAGSSAGTSIGATVFFSRLNNRGDPQCIVITLAYQLAVRIQAYRIYITGRIALDPSLLGKGMSEQFRIFIAEPFGNNGIGKGDGPWAVMLDGLDECEGMNEQSRVVRLVSEFVLNFPNAPLIWTIASRPEPHIVAAFNNEQVASSHWSEYVPLYSTQACRDVEYYLDARFKAMRKRFPHVPPTWPSRSQFLKLSNSTRGLFAIARATVTLMDDPNYADPVSRLNFILSIIDRLDIKLIGDRPFVLLDAIYTQMLIASINSD